MNTYLEERMKMSNKVKMGQESNPIGGVFLKYDEQGLKSVRRNDCKLIKKNSLKVVGHYFH